MSSDRRTVALAWILALLVPISLAAQEGKQAGDSSHVLEQFNLGSDVRLLNAPGDLQGQDLPIHPRHRL